MAVLIIFETVEGQTRKVARFVESAVRKAGLDAVPVNTAEPTGPVSFEGVDKVILAAPVHERRHPKAFEEFVTANLDRLKECDTLMLSVSLKAAFPETLEEAQDFLVEMEMRTGFTPDAEALVAGAVHTASYDYFSAMIVQYVVLRGQDFDLKDGEREFTDWAALQKTVSDFLAGAPAP
jgi:menaquinone-dependent protoporphyrinogen oxidase